MKFGKLKYNDMPMTTNRSKLKSEVKFLYGGCLFSETGSSNILAVNQDISSKFGMQVTSTSLNECSDCGH